MEQWLPLQDYPGYEVSDRGRVRSSRSGAVLAISHNQESRPHVGMMLEGVQVKRGLSLLVARAFIPQSRTDFDTPIHFNGDLTDCRVSNLDWRPRWFALRHTDQFRRAQVDTDAVRNINTGIFYRNVWEVVYEFGVLYNDVVKSIVNKTYVFPLMQCFEWVDPD